MHKKFGSTIFVFGSNMDGHHGAGAARFARDWMGAIEGQAEGLQGSSYAIPAKNVSLAQIEAGIDRFAEFAEANEDMQFMLTRIACGRNGHPENDIRELVRCLPANVMFPGIWREKERPAVIIAGTRTFKNYELLERCVNNLTQRMGTFTIISGGAEGADSLGEAYAKRNGFSEPEVYEADWDRFVIDGRKIAGPVRNQFLSWRGTHLISFWDGISTGTRNMHHTAQHDKLQVRMVKYGK